MFRTGRCEVRGPRGVLGDVPHGEVRGPGTMVGVGRIRTAGGTKFRAPYTLKELGGW